MILDVLIFALGALTAGLLALAVLPAVWRRALRLSEERLSRLVPLSGEEIAAERDHLRAEHAVALRRAEQRWERADAERAALRVAAARRETHVVQIEAERASWQLKAGEREKEGAALRSEVQGLWAEIGAEAMALHGLSGLAEGRLRDIAALQAERVALRGELDRLGHEVDRSRTSLAGLETRLVGADTRNGDLQRELAGAMRELNERRDAAEASRTAPPERDVAAARDLGATGHDPAASGHDLVAPAATDGNPEPKQAQAGEVEALRIELAFMAEQAASAERRATDAAKALDALRAERAAAVEADRRRPDDDAGLRIAIAALADDVLRAGRGG